jgi:hypothetical protein
MLQDIHIPRNLQQVQHSNATDDNLWLHYGTCKFTIEKEKEDKHISKDLQSNSNFSSQLLVFVDNQLNEVSSRIVPPAQQLPATDN